MQHPTTTGTGHNERWHRTTDDDGPRFDKRSGGAGEGDDNADNTDRTSTRLYRCELLLACVVGAYNDDTDDALPLLMRRREPGGFLYIVRNSNILFSYLRAPLLSERDSLNICFYASWVWRSKCTKIKLT
jgi:hypothetical protein